MTGRSAEQLLVIEDDRPTRSNLRDILELDGYSVCTAGSMGEARAMPEWRESAVVILDRRLPDGLAEEMLPALTESAPDAMFVIVTGHHDLAGAVACLTCGAEDYILKPLNADALRASVRRALEHRRARIALRRTEDQLRQTLGELEQRVAQRTSELEQANAELLLLKNLALGIASQSSLDSAMRLTLDRICEATGWDCGEAWLAADDVSRLVLRAQCSEDDRLAPFHAVSAELSFEQGEGLPGRVWADRKALWVGDLLDSEVFCRADAARSCGLTAGLGVPIFSGENLVAVMTFFIRDPRQEDSRLVQLVTAAVAPLGPVIERKHIEDRLAQHKDELEILIAERTAQLRQADRLASLGTLAAGLGHDMHNVLLPVRSRLDVLEADALPPRAREQLPAIRRAITYLQELSDGLHLLALDSSDEDATTATTNLSEWWSQLGPLLAKTLPKLVAFKCDIPENLPPVNVAPHRLTQAVLNLLVNAGEAIVGEGEVRLQAECASQRSSTRMLVRLSVNDTGEGMSEEVQRRALDPFFTTKKRGLGTGLGLSLVHGVVQTAGGSVEIESKTGIGTTVALLLPAIVRNAPATKHSAGEEGVARCATVTLTDDRMAGFISTFLTAAGYDLHTLPEDKGIPLESALWVIDSAAAPLDAGRRFLRTGRNRRMIVVGAEADDWASIGAQVVADASDIESLRRAINKSCAA